MISVFVYTPPYANADNFIIEEECISEGWLATITDLEGTPLTNVTLLTVKEMRSSGYEESFSTDDNGMVFIPLSSITGFVKVTKGGFTDRLLSISCDLSTEHADTIDFDFLSYDDPLFGIKIDYPSNWQKTTSNPNFLVAFISPQESNNDVYPESVAIMTQNVEFDDPADLALSYTSLLSTTTTQEFQLLKNIQTTIGDHLAQTIIFTSNMQGNESKVIVYFTIVDNVGYTIFFDTEAVNYEKHLPLFGQMIESLEIKPKVSEIPSWIKNNAGWWAEGNIDDEAFVEGIQFLIKEGIINIPETANLTSQNPSKEIPSWIKNNANWWSQELISDDDFLKGITFMVENKLIIVD